MFKLAGRHEWEAWTKGKFSECVGGKNDERGNLVLREYTGWLTKK